jgi:hypothetical protein
MREIFFESESPDSKKLAIFEDNGSSAWLYLASARNHEVESDVFVYSPVEPDAELDRASIKQGNAPKLCLEYASGSAVFSPEDENDLSVLWSSNSKSVAILYRDEVLAAIYEGEKRGYSKALSKKCGFGKPWSDEKFAQHIGDAD